MLDGQPVHFKSPMDARKVGIETVYQDLAVAPAMSIAENLFLGREVRRAGLPRQRAAHARQEEDAGDQHRAHERPEGRHPLDDAGGGDALRRPAPVCGGGARRGLCRACGDPRRADRRARRQGGQHGARADPPCARQGPAGDPDQPQHAACLRNRRPHPRRPAGQTRRGAEPEEDQHERHRGGDDRCDAAGSRSRPSVWPEGSRPC